MYNLQLKRGQSAVLEHRLVLGGRVEVEHQVTRFVDSFHRPVADVCGPPTRIHVGLDRLEPLNGESKVEESDCDHLGFGRDAERSVEAVV